MKSQIYSWKRFYCPRTGNISLSDGGYLSDPDSEFGHIYNPEVQPFEKISDSPCLVLLGEPGIGKSKAILSEKTSLEATVQAQGDKLLSFDLREYGSEDRLVRDIFKCEDFISWKNGNSQLHLFLDSLDECRLRVSNVTPLLINKLRNLPRERLCIRIACRTFNWSNDQELSVNTKSIKETLATGLFSSRGPNRLGFAHQTYAEFLAAYYLAHIDPEVLLRSDVAKASPKARERLVKKLLYLFDEEELHDRISDVWRHYEKLSHPLLADQLRPYISDRSKNDVVRRVAIEIAATCKVKTLQDDLLHIAITPAEELLIRVEAADAMAAIADNETRKKLRPLITGNIDEDAEDQLKGAVLRALWPDNLTVQELFSLITVPKRTNFVGSYQMFLSSDLPTHLQASDLPIALKWVTAQAADHKLPYVFRKITDKVMHKAWEQLDAPGVLAPFAAAALSRLKRNDDVMGEDDDSLWRDSLIREGKKRRTLLKAMVRILPEPPEERQFLVYGQSPMAINCDLPWLIEQYQEEESDTKKIAWLDLIRTALDVTDSKHIELIYNFSQVDSPLSESFAWLLKPVDIFSPEAEKIKKRFYEIGKMKARSTKRALLEPPPDKRIKDLLDECEAKDPTVWWHLTRELTLEPDSTHYGNDITPDIRIYPGWKAADDITRARILKTAQTYLKVQDPNQYNWLGDKTFYRPVLAGYKALRLLYSENKIG